LKSTNPTSAPTYPILFEEIANNLSSDVVVYLIGGENLRIKGIKNKTKDCDLLVTNNASLEVIVKALENLGYNSSDKKRRLEDRLTIEPSVMLKHPTRLPVDIFTTTVVKKLYLSDTMKQRARFEDFDGKHRLRLGILQNEDVFLLKCVTTRKHDTQDMFALVTTQNFNWDIVWQEIGKQDKDTGKVVFVIIADNIDRLAQQGGLAIPFHEKLRRKVIDEMICTTIRKNPMYKDELISNMQDDDVTAEMVEARLSRLLRIRLIKDRKLIDGRILLRATKATVLKYCDLDAFYDQEHFIDYGSLVKRIEILCFKLDLSTRHRQIGKEIAHIIGRDPLYISNRITNLAPAIVYTIIRWYKLPVTRKTISITANVSQPSLTGLYHKIIISLKKYFNKR
jgi:hypothetical protein